MASESEPACGEQSPGVSRRGFLRGVGVTLVAQDQARELAGMVRGLGLHRELELAGMPAGAPDREGQRPGNRRARSNPDREC